MNAMRKDKIVYHINVADIQTVAQEELERDLTDEEINVVEEKIGEQIDWYEAIRNIIITEIE